MCKASVTKAKMQAMGIDENGRELPEPKSNKPDSQEYRVFIGESPCDRVYHKLMHEQQGTL